MFEHPYAVVVEMWTEPVEFVADSACCLCNGIYLEQEKICRFAGLDLANIERGRLLRERVIGRLTSAGSQNDEDSEEGDQPGHA